MSLANQQNETVSSNQNAAKETHFKLTYTKLSGERAEKIFPTMERLQRALARTKAENHDHDMAETVTEVEVEIPTPTDFSIPGCTGTTEGFIVYFWDTDCECWETAQDLPVFASRTEAEDEARYLKKQCSYRLKSRVVKI